MTSPFTLHATLRVPPAEWEAMDLVRHTVADGAAFRLCVVESSDSAGWRDEPLHIGTLNSICSTSAITTANGAWARTSGRTLRRPT